MMRILHVFVVMTTRKELFTTTIISFISNELFVPQITHMPGF